MCSPLAVRQGSHDLGVCIFAVCWDLANRNHAKRFPQPLLQASIDSATENKHMLNLYRKPSKSAKIVHFQHECFPAGAASRSLSRPERVSFGFPQGGWPGQKKVDAAMIKLPFFEDGLYYIYIYIHCILHYTTTHY